jgi:rhodanese-related sulfurtransferase
LNCTAPAGRRKSLPTLLFCSIGMRSNIALMKLKEHGVSNFCNIDELRHAEEVAAAAG